MAVNPKKPMLLFDLDGTLWDSAVPVAESWNEVYRREDPSLPLLNGDDIRTVMGLTMPDIEKRIHPTWQSPRRDEVFETCCRYEVEYLHTHCGDLYPDLRPVMETLLSEGYQLGIVSNCQEGYIGAFLASSGTGDLFSDYEEWGRTGLVKGENIRLVLSRNGHERGIYIGDTAKDQEASRMAGIPFIHAAYGFGVANNPEGIIHSLTELPEAVHRISGD